jgi:Lrp/AsnC family transcriptional regulator, regulator for asnA, asnC and gidA
VARQPHLDDIDLAVIEQLQRDGRLPYTKLGAAVGLSEAAVRQRVQRLLDLNVMQVVAVTDPLSLGRRRVAMVGMKVEGDVPAAADLVGAIEGVEYVVMTAGSFDILAEVVAVDDEALLALISAIRAVPKVRSTESFIYLKLAKQTFSWGAR